MAAVVRMPEVATGAAEAAIQAWLVEVGQPVVVGQPLVEIETDKALVEYEAEAAGVLAGILLPAGQSAAVGSPIAVLAADGESVEEALSAAAGSAPVAEPAAPEEASIAERTDTPSPERVDPPVVQSAAPPESDHGTRLFASPLVRRLARERGIDLGVIVGSGPKGRIVRRDLDALPASTPPLATRPASGAEAAAAYEDIPHSGMRRAIARRLTESKGTIPHFYLVADCRVDALLDLREQINAGSEPKVSVNDLVVKAVAGALLDVPDANAIWTDDAVRRFTGVDLAIAVSVESGLLTPVLRGADRLSISDLSATIRDLVDRARRGRLKQDELEGGSFSVSNLGMYGTSEFSAIINPPHAGILAVGAATRRPVVDEATGELVAARVMRVTLSADHRVLDGSLAAQWLAAFVARIERPVSILV